MEWPGINQLVHRFALPEWFYYSYAIHFCRPYTGCQTAVGPAVASDPACAGINVDAECCKNLLCP